MLHLVGGHDQEVTKWTAAVLQRHFVEPTAAFGVVSDDGGGLMGAAIFNDFYRGGNLELSYMGPRTLTRRLIRGLATYAFKECGASRVTAKTERRNRIVQRILPRLGFSLEGSQKRYFGPEKGQDALVFVLHKRDAPKWMVGD